MRLRGLFSSCVQPPALKSLDSWFQALKNTAGDTLGLVITNTVNSACPYDLAST